LQPGEVEHQLPGHSGQRRLHPLPQERGGEHVEFAAEGDDEVTSVGIDVDSEIVGHAQPEAPRYVSHGPILPVAAR
jgi:hypothetical protein